MFYGANIRNLRLPSYFVPAGGLNVFNLTWNGRMNAMCDMFNDCKASSITGLENWDVSNVERFDSLFRRVINLESLPNVSKWDTSHVVNLHHAFYQDSDASKTKLADISAIANWDVSNVEDMWDTFCYCHKLTNLEAIRNWDVSKVQTLRGTFFKCSNLTSLEALSNWNTKSVTNLRSTFAGPSKFTSLHGLENWDTSNVTNMFETFRGNTQLTDISVTCRATGSR